MTITTNDVLAWIDGATKADVEAIVDDLIDRELAVSPTDYAELQQELARAEDAADDIDAELLVEVRSRLIRRDYREALHTLVLVLGRDFDGLETMPLGAA